jgi:hypothetical protein
VRAALLNMSTPDTLETILLLLWRHLAVYIEKGEGISLSVPTSFAQSTRGVVNYDKTSFHNEVIRQMQAALQPLADLHMVSLSHNRS